MGLPAFLCSSAISTDGRSMVPQQPGEIQSYQVPQYCCSGVCRVSGRSSIRSPQAGHWGISMRAVYLIFLIIFLPHHQKGDTNQRMTLEFLFLHALFFAHIIPRSIGESNSWKSQCCQQRSLGLPWQASSKKENINSVPEYSPACRDPQ